MSLKKFSITQPTIKLIVEKLTVTALYTLFPEMFGKTRAVCLDFRLKRYLRQAFKMLGESRMCRSFVNQFVAHLRNLREPLMLDAVFIAQNDPAAHSCSEVIVSYPGFYAICVYRIAHQLANLGAVLVPRLMTELAHAQTGIDIHPRARIGTEFFIDHGTGIVIGETACIGNRVKLYQGVTIGALSVSKSMSRVKRHPTLQDDVVVYAGATILGGGTVIGHNSVIGGNVWLTTSVPPFSKVYHRMHVYVVDNKPVMSIL